MKNKSDLDWVGIGVWVVLITSAIVGIIIAILFGSTIFPEKTNSEAYKFQSKMNALDAAIATKDAQKILAASQALNEDLPKKSTTSEKPLIPRVSNWIELSENEFQEIERRCIGVTHPTCDELPKARTGRKNVDEFKKAGDRAVRAYDDYINGRR